MENNVCMLGNVHHHAADSVFRLGKHGDLVEGNRWSRNRELSAYILWRREETE